MIYNTTNLNVCLKVSYYFLCLMWQNNPEITAYLILFYSLTYNNFSLYFKESRY